MPDAVTNNIGAVAVSALFLWYMTKRDNAFNAVITEFSKKMESLSHAISSLERRLTTIEDKNK